jgi:hypothetical protein
MDPLWIEKHRSLAMQGLKDTNKRGFMEIHHFCSEAVVAKKQEELVPIAEQAAVHTFGWPIGIVLHRKEFQPRPTNDGIVANVRTDHDYDYWALTKNGDFYALMSLFEDDKAEGVLYFDTRIVRTTEAILHCTNLYKVFSVEPSASVIFTVRYSGLRGRTLTAASPNRALSYGRQNLNENEVVADATFRVGIGSREIIPLMKSLCEPLFVLSQ